MNIEIELGGVLNIWADFSHYVHQLENAVCMKNHPAFAPGRRPGRADFEAVVDQVIHSDRIVGGHLRCAAPSPLGRERGAIQYPIVAPSSDPASRALHYDDFNIL